MEAGIQSGEAWTTARLGLRRPTVADVGEVLRLHQDLRATQHNPADALEDETAARQLVQTWVQHWDDHAIGYWMLSWRVDAAVLGVCGVKVMTINGRQVLNLLYRLHPAAWGQGVASEAAVAVVNRAVQHHQGLPVVARVRPDNYASARVALAARLVRAEHLDIEGEAGAEHLFVSRAPATLPPDR